MARICANMLRLARGTDSALCQRVVRVRADILIGGSLLYLRLAGPVSLPVLASGSCSGQRKNRSPGWMIRTVAKGCFASLRPALARRPITARSPAVNQVWPTVHGSSRLNSRRSNMSGQPVIDIGGWWKNIPVRV
eukprot:1180463-Prorocentrum_minimum.AAC.3